RPRNMSDLVADNEFSQQFEFASLPAKAHSSNARFRPTIPMGINLVFPCLADVRINFDIALCQIADLSPEQSQRRQKSNRCVAEVVFSTSGWQQPVTPGPAATGGDRQLGFARAQE